jgi:hypothetical protein
MGVFLGQGPAHRGVLSIVARQLRPQEEYHWKGENIMSLRSQRQNYLRVPHGDVRKTLALSTALLSAVPDDASPPVTAAAAEFHTATDVLGAQYDLRQQETGGGLSEFNHRSDRAWSALYYVLYGTSRIPVDSPRKKLAHKLLGSLFSDGLSFLALSYRDQWVESKRRLQRIEEKNLAEPIAQATGDTSILDAVQTTHNAFGDALNITEADSTEETPNLTVGVRNVRQAMSYYIVQVIAWGQADGGRHLAKAYRALRPIDVARGLVPRAAGSGSQPEGEQADTSEASDASDTTPESSDSAPTSEAEPPTEGSDPAAA